jgi:hypothetical protein
MVYKSKVIIFILLTMKDPLMGEECNIAFWRWMTWREKFSLGRI